MESKVLRELGRIVAGGYGDHQQVRQQMMNRIRVVIRMKNEGLPFDKPEEKKGDDEKNFDAKYQDVNLTPLLEEMIKAGKITDTEYDYLKKAIELADKAKSLERSFVGPMERLIESEPLWIKFLYHVRGIGAVLAAKLMAKIGDCSRYEHVSSLWRHFGFHLVCPKCVEKVEGKTIPLLVNADGKCSVCGSPGVGPKRKKGQGIDYDSRLRSLAWNIGNSLVKQRSPVYYEIYKREKARQLERVYPQGELARIYGDPYKAEDVNLKLIHAHNRALRKMVKIFLQHCWIISRREAGLPLTDPYAKGKLGHQDIVTPEDVHKANEADPQKKSEAA
jgi:hypothetical protein